MSELLLDPDIRLWVFLPIVIITFLFGIVRHYISILLTSPKKVEITQVQDRYVCMNYLRSALNIFAMLKLRVVLPHKRYPKG